MTFSFFLKVARWRLHRYILGRRKTIKRLNIHLGPKKSVKQKRPFLLLSKCTYGQKARKISFNYFWAQRQILKPWKSLIVSSNTSCCVQTWSWNVYGNVFFVWTSSYNNWDYSDRPLSMLWFFLQFQIIRI